MFTGMKNHMGFEGLSVLCSLGSVDHPNVLPLLSIFHRQRLNKAQ